MYKLFFHPRAEKFLLKIAGTDSKNLIKKLEILAVDPYKNSLDIKKLSGVENYYRFRYRNIRIIYKIKDIEKQIQIWEIDFRGNVY